ncbi:DUF983 domain-containing protein [Sphingobium algorifonticola]|jgi:uncharacterized protein (DUF983 family)|uniref:DUF983 domain-containing protein n=1 Tax=Sphingobium algorifonticola TaxID=2008318 RepID=A0A437J4H7_9SPHN|nr:DUF983 domain-containing protein [Sphingobium algorifonticola]RVT39566.1 DUF983 domain-containing protein [Sphingobium algorifonticola]
MPEPDAFDALRRRLAGGEAKSGEQSGRASPGSVWAAIGRGFLGHCPCCGQGKLFQRFLKPVALCASCQEDWTPQQADDFPAYVSIFLTGHILAPLIIALVKDTEFSVAALMALIVPLAIVMMIGLLQPAKGAIIALQWWFGMHGFEGRKKS